MKRKFNRLLSSVLLMAIIVVGTGLSWGCQVQGKVSEINPTTEDSKQLLQQDGGRQTQIYMTEDGNERTH